MEHGFATKIVKKFDYPINVFNLHKSQEDGFEIIADRRKNHIPIPDDNPIIQDLNTTWNVDKFLTKRNPVSLGLLTDKQLMTFSQHNGLKVSDMPIKFPGSTFKIPENLRQFKEVIELIAHYEAAINTKCFDEYYCYLTVDQGWITPKRLQRETPCHVDGFQGARWNPKTKINHSYVVSSSLPTTYYIQPFDLRNLDESKHNFCWEMNNIVAKTKSKHAWKPKEGEINLIDAYTVHRGTEAREITMRTWLRLSFEVRKFDHLGNTHNPLFHYDWEMHDRNVENLHLIAYDMNCDPSLRVYPWQDIDGKPLKSSKPRTKPKLR